MGQEQGAKAQLEAEKSVKPAIDQDDDDVETSTVNERILKESKKYKERLASERARAAELQAQLDAVKQAELEKQGKEKERADYYQGKYDSLNKQIMKRNVEDKVAAIAQQMGCEKPKAVLSLGNSSLLSYDESTGEVIGAESLVDEVKREYPELFSKAKRHVVNSSIPTTKVVDGHSEGEKLRAKVLKGTTKDFAELLRGSSLMNLKR